MDVYTAKIQIDKLLEYVQELNDNHPRMYAKSKDRWREVAQTCSQVIKVISTLIQDSALQVDGDDDETVGNSELMAIVLSMQSEFNDMKKFIKYEPECKPSSTTKSNSSSGSNKVPRDICKSTMADYRKVIDKLHKLPSEYLEVKECIDLIYTWFDSRFIKSGSSCKYNIKRISSWIYDIVIVYSYHLCKGDVQDFIQTFNQWCNNVVENPESCKYAVPYEIYEQDSEKFPDRLTLTAVVLWDLLLHIGLSELCRKTEYNTYLDESYIYKLCEKFNQEQLDRYEHFSVNSDILRYCGIHKYS